MGNLRILKKNQKELNMKRIGLMTAVILLLAGCNFQGRQKIEAYQRWHQARAQVICSVASEHLKVGQLDEAGAKALEAIHLDGKYLPAHLVLVKVRLEQGRYADALSQLAKAAPLDAENAEIPYLRGVAQEKRGEDIEALKAYQQARALDESNDAYAMASAEVLVAMGRPKQALELLKARLAHRDGNAAMLALAGELAMLVDAPGEGAEFFRQALDACPKSVSLLESLAKAYFFAARYDKAVEALSKLVADHDKAGWIYLMMGTCHMRLNRPLDARRAYQAGTDVAPDQAPLWVCLAQAALVLNDAPRAIVAARRALALGECLEASAVLGYAMLREGKPESAAQVLSKVAQKRPDDATVWCALGRCYAAQGQDDQAASCYVRALRSDPQHRLARALLAGVNTERKDLK